MLDKLALAIVEVFYHCVIGQWSEDIKKIVNILTKSSLKQMIYRIADAYDDKCLELQQANNREKEYVAKLKAANENYMITQRKYDDAHQIGSILLENMPKQELADYIMANPYIHKVGKITTIRSIFRIGLVEAKEYYNNHINKN